MSIEPTTAFERSRFRVHEGSCVDCAGDVTRGLRELPGVRRVDVAPAAGLVIVEHDGRVAPDAVCRQAARHGLRLLQAGAGADVIDRRWWRQPRFAVLAIAGVALLIGLLVGNLFKLETAASIFYGATVAIGGFYPARSGLHALRTGRLTISTLLVVAAAGAVALGVLEEAAILVVVFSLGEVLEEYVSDRARGTIHALMRLAPSLATRRLPTGHVESVPVEVLAPGDVIFVQPGERLPTDGIIANGLRLLAPPRVISRGPSTGRRPDDSTPAVNLPTPASSARSCALCRWTSKAAEI